MTRRQSFPLHPVLRHIAQPFWRLTRGQTLGVRGVVRNERGHVLLVRHSYAPGWLFPGGGVERSETLEQALAREMSEEVGVTVEGKALLFGIYANFERFAGDHVALFLIDAWRREPVRSLEIAEDEFFPPDDLPEGVTGATRRRLAEILGAVEIAPMW